MRRLIVCLLIALTLAGCKSRRRRATLEPVAQTGLLATMLQVGDPHSSEQLTRGFYGIENGSWRWTARNFSAMLHTPRNAAQNEARLVLHFAIPDVVIQQLKTITLSAKVNGLAVDPQTFAQPGETTYTRDVPAAALTADVVPVDFQLDKALPPSAGDQRELGVIVSAIGFEAK